MTSRHTSAHSHKPHAAHNSTLPTPNHRWMATANTSCLWVTAHRLAPLISCDCPLAPRGPTLDALIFPRFPLSFSRLDAGVFLCHCSKVV
ncbi:hypothetical protein T01_5958 [Trichinella spiralis]|uniref:Uncharacterized protein n=1 Tax=Trichinella spiralis TaxID=6334 RepID=A0A0V1AZR6_TRISP|nr:hypothetical protein T01_5958 [Trichinella spiralis]